MRDNKQGNVVNILRNVGQLEIAGKLFRKYNKNEETHEVFYVKEEENMITQSAYDELDSSEKMGINVISVLSTYKRSKNHPGVMITTELDMYLMDSMEIDVIEMFNSSINTLRMVDILEIIEALNFDLKSNLSTNPDSIIDLRRFNKEVQNSIKGEFPEYVQATHLLYPKMRNIALENFKKKEITLESTETNDFILKELQESEAADVYVYAESTPKGQVTVVETVSSSSLWSMRLTRDSEGTTTQPEIMYSKFVNRSESEVIIKSLYYLTSIAGLSEKEIMDQVPNILLFF